MRERDPLGYYAALNVSPTASSEEIRLAYQFLKQAHRAGRRHRNLGKVHAGYEILTDPKRRADYDAGRVERPSAGEVLKQMRPWFGSTVTLAASVLLLAVVLGSLFGSRLVSELKSYAPGDELVWKAGERPLGSVVSFEEAHTFPNGVVAPAYAVRAASGDTPAWYPEDDLQRHARRAK